MSQEELVKFAIQLKAERDAAMAKLRKRSGYDKPFATSISEYKGNKVLRITGPMMPMCIGKTKARAIIAVFEDIKKFADIQQNSDDGEI